MRFQRTVAFLFCFLFIGAVFAVPAQAEVKIGETANTTWYTEVHAVGALQGLDQSNNASSPGDKLNNLDPTFHTAFANLDWRIELDDYAELYFDATQSSRVKADRWWGHEGYMKIKRFPEGYPLSVLNPMMNIVDIKVGAFDVNYGWYPQTSSINADVQRNPLIGNYVVRPLATEAGMEIMSKEGPVNWNLGFGQGNSTEDAREGKGFSYHGKVWGDITPGVELAASAYRLDSSLLEPGHGSGPGHLYVSERMGGRYASVFGGGGAPGNVLPGNGFDETAYQLDLRTNPMKNLSVNALYGMHMEDDANGDSTSLTSATTTEPEQDWIHYGATARYDLTKHAYLAGRYSKAELDKWEDFDGTTSSSSGNVTRIQAGVGMWIFDGFLGKLEYVKEEASDFNENAALGTDATLDPEFDGLIAEFSMTY